MRRASKVCGTAVVIIVLAGCGQVTPGAASAPAPGGSAAAGGGGPIATVEPTCAADYPQHGDVAELVENADLVVRATATGLSRDYESQPEPPSEPETDPLVSTALTVEVTEAVKGSILVGDVLEVQQNDCTARPLPSGPNADYVFALRVWEVGEATSQLNDSQATWQVVDGHDLLPVNPSNDLGVETLDELRAAATTQGATD